MNRPNHERTAGQTLVEFALVLPLFLLLIFGIIDFGRLFYTQMTAQHALREAGRFAVTGNTKPADPKDPSGPQKSRIASIVQAATDAAPGLDLTYIKINNTLASDNKASAGGPGDTVTITLTYDLPLVTPMIGHFFNNGAYTFTVSTTFKNEPFPVTPTP